MTVLWIALASLALALVVTAVGFNRLRRADLRAQEALGGIDVQLTRRADLVPNLVATVKGYATHESSVLTDVTQARSAVAASSRSGASVTDRAAAEAALDRSLVNILALAEAYPQLRASESFGQLQAELADTEDQLAFARQYYNDAVTTLNTDVVTIPWMLFAGLARVGKRDFYEAPAHHDAPPAVTF